MISEKTSLPGSCCHRSLALLFVQRLNILRMRCCRQSRGDEGVIKDHFRSDGRSLSSLTFDSYPGQVINRSVPEPESNCAMACCRSDVVLPRLSSLLSRARKCFTHLQDSDVRQQRVGHCRKIHATRLCPNLCRCRWRILLLRDLVLTTCMLIYFGAERIQFVLLIRGDDRIPQLTTYRHLPPKPSTMHIAGKSRQDRYRRGCWSIPLCGRMRE